MNIILGTSVVMGIDAAPICRETHEAGDDVAVLLEVPPGLGACDLVLIRRKLPVRDLVLTPARRHSAAGLFSQKPQDQP